MKIFCVYLSDYNDRNDYFLSLMPYGITSIAAFLEKDGHDVTLANLSSYGFSRAAELTVKSKPDAVAISIFSFNRTESLKYIRELKKRNSKIVIIAGGQHPTFLASQIVSRYPEINFIIKGEGEFSIKKLIDNSFINDETIINSDRISDISTIPFASLFEGKMIGINPNEQFKFIITSRGCPSSCTYCSSPNFWEKKVTYRDPEDILKELKHINQKYGIIYFSIRDDNFTLNKARVLKFCNLLKESGIYMMWNCQARVDTIDEEMLIAMKKSGLEHIQFGVESGSEKILKLYDKHITVNKIKKAAALTRKTGLYLSFYLMTGMTGETHEDIEETRKLISETMPHDVIISPVAYYPGTKIYSDSVKKDKIDDNIWFNSEKNGLYLEEKQGNEKNIKNLLIHSAKISRKSEYKKSDFKVHRETTGEDCWMNYIIEGDYFSEKSDYKKSYSCYSKVITEYPDNVWGYLRLAELIYEKSPVQSLELFIKASKIVPSYYGSWLRIAQIHHFNRNISEAKLALKKALQLNQDDPETIELLERIKKN